MCKPLNFIPCLLWLWSLPGACGDVPVQNARYDVRFNHLSLEEGLSQASVYTMVQDRFGWMWMGTQDGLNRFDGHRVVVYKKEEGPLRLSDNWIRTLYEQPGGDLWIGTLNGGLNRYDRERERMMVHQHDPNDPSTLSGNDIRCIWGDNGDRDILWIGVKGGGLNRFQISTGQVTRFFQRDPAWEGNNVQAVYEDRAGRLWVGSEAGLALFNRTTNQFEPTPLKGRVTDLLELSSEPGVLWFSLDNEMVSGLCRFNTETGKHQMFAGLPHGPFGEKLGDVNSLFEDRNGHLWIGARHGLFRYDPKLNTMEGIFHDPANPNGLTQNTISCIYEDRPGVLWVSTFTAGVNYCDPTAFLFRHYSSNPNNENSLGSSTVRSLAMDEEGALWVATMERGLDRFSPDRKQVTHFRHDPQNPRSIHTDELHSVATIGGHLWIGGAEAGLDRYDPETSSFVHYDYRQGRKELGTNAFYLLGDQTDPEVIWICTWTHGLLQFNHRTQTTRVFQHTEKPGALSDDMVTYALEDGPDRLWVCTMRGGLNLLDRQTGRFKHYKPDADDPTSLGHVMVNSVFKDRSGELWVATGGGLGRLIGEGRFQHFTVSDGLPNNYIYGCLEDEDGALWLSTNRGLSRLDPQREAFHNYDVRDGLQGNEFNRGSFLKGVDDLLYFGGINGFNVFRTGAVQHDPGKTPIMITRMAVNNRTITPHQEQSPLNRSLAFTSEVTLNHFQNDFSLEFAVMNFTNSDRNRYAYRLEPYNRDWVETDAFNRMAVYTNLDQGSYVFQVKGLDRYGVWSEAEPFHIHIRPAPWKSPLAQVGYLLLILALAHGVVSHQRKKLEQKNQANLMLEKQVAERTLSLKSKNQELEALDRIVRAINQETDLEKLLTQLLNQAIELFPNAEKGALLKWDESAGFFRYIAHSGYDVEKLSGVKITRENMAAILAHNIEQVSDDLWLARTVDVDQYPEHIKKIVGARSILGMGLVLDKEIDAILYLTCYSKANAFDETDAATLERLRGHTLSALAKANLLQKLKEKTLAILQTQQQLLIQEKMASLGTLTAGIAHEINNPTNYAFGGAQNMERDLRLFREFLLSLLKDETDLEFLREFNLRLDPLFQHADTIMEGAQRIMNIVRDLHTFSHEDGAAREQIALTNHIQSAVNLVKGEFKERVQFQLAFEGSLQIFCSPAEINQVVLNLLTNGCQAILKKQDQEQDRTPGLVKVTARQEGDQAVALFQDNGCGMTESLRRKIFEPFFTTSQVGQGSGLGLASSYNIIRKLGGSLEVVSKIDKGSTITLKLPIARIQRKELNMRESS